MPSHFPARLYAETQLKTLTGRAYAIGCGRGSAVIEAALNVIGARNRPVLIPANTCYAVLWAVLHAGAIPYLVDCDPRTGNINAETLEQAGIDHPAAVIPCHLYGSPAPMRDISHWAHARGAFVIEDAALAVGAVVEGKPAGSWGDISLFSFGTGKIIDCGNGGAALTDDPALAGAMRAALDALPAWREHTDQLIAGWGELYWALHRHEAINPALAELYPRLFDLYGETLAFKLPPEAWRGLPQALDDLPANLAHRAALAAAYDAAFPAAIKPARASGAVLWKYPLLIDPARRDAVLADLWAEGIHEASCWYPSLQRMHAALVPDPLNPPTPHADHWGASILNLPLTTSEDAVRIAALVSAAL